MTVIEELQSVIDKIESEPDHDACVRVMNRYLKKRLIQRLPESEQAQKLYADFQTGNVERVRAYRVSQYGRVREQSENFIRIIQNESRPEQVRVLRSEGVNA